MTNFWEKVIGHLAWSYWFLNIMSSRGEKFFSRLLRIGCGAGSKYCAMVCIHVIMTFTLLPPIIGTFVRRYSINVHTCHIYITSHNQQDQTNETCACNIESLGFTKVPRIPTSKTPTKRDRVDIYIYVPSYIWYIPSTYLRSYISSYIRNGEFRILNFNQLWHILRYVWIDK